MAIRSEPYLISDLAEEYNPAPAGNEPRLVPLDPNITTTQTPEEYQVADMGKTVGLALGRILRPTARYNELGNAYTRLQEKLKKERELKQTFEAATVTTESPEGKVTTKLKPGKTYDVREVPGQAEADIGRPQWQAIDNRTSPPTVMNEGEPFRTRKEAKAFLKEHQGRVEVETPPPVRQEADDVPLSEKYVGPLVDEMDRNDGYKMWLTLGDEELDRAMEGALKSPLIDDGVIAGIRVHSKEGADVPPGMETKVPDEGNIYGYLDSTGDAIKRRLNQLGEEEQKRITQEQTEALANILGHDPNKLARDFMGGEFKLGHAAPGELAAKMVAGKNLLVSEIKKLDELTDIARKEGTNKSRYEWKRQAELVANIQRAFRGAQTEIARSLSAMRIPAHADADLLSRDYKKIVDNFGGSDQLDAVIDAYSKSSDLPGRAQQTRQLTKWQKLTDSVHEVWINSMLSGWFTHAKNTAGVAAAMVWEIAELSTTAALQSQRALYGRQRDVTFSDVAAKMFGQMMSMREAFGAAGRGFWLREDALYGAEMSLISGNNPSRGADAFSAQAWEAGGVWGQAVNFSGHVLTLGRAPTRALMMEDAFMKTVSYRGALWEEGFRQGRFAGKKGEELSEFIADFVYNPPAEAAQRAREGAKYVTLQSDMDPTGSLKKYQDAFGGRVGRMIVPFFKTPTNAILYIAERSPFAFRMKRYTDAVKEGGAVAANARTRMAMGMGVMGWMVAHYNAENITGGLSADYDVVRAYQRQGIKPYHIKIGNTWVNYNLLEPLSTMVGLVVDAMEIMNHSQTDERTVQEVGIAVAGAIGYNLSNKTFMTGLSLVLESISDPGRHGGRLLTQYARSILVPGSAALADIERANNDLKSLRVQLRDEIKARLPGFSDELPPQRDLWGRKIVDARFRSPYNPNPVDQELVRLQLGLSKHPTNLDGEVGLELEEIDWFHERAGKLAFKYMSDLVDPKTQTGKVYARVQKASMAGDELATEECKNILRKALLSARTEAKASLVGLHPDRSTHSPYAAEILQIMQNIAQEKKDKAEATKRLIQGQ